MAIPRTGRFLAGVVGLGAMGMVLAVLTAADPARGQGKLDVDNVFVAATLEGFFPGESRGAIKRLNAYMVRRRGKWVAGIGTPTYQGRPQWNSALMLVDPSGLALTDSKLEGKLSVVLVPDPWVPKDQKARVAQVELRATLSPGGAPDSLASLRGEWSATIEGDKQALTDAGLLGGSGKGNVSGGCGALGAPDLSDVSLDLAVYGLMPGKAKESFHRRRAISIGYKDGKFVSARFGMMDIRHSMFDWETLETPTEGAVTADTLACAVSFKASTLDGDPATFRLAFQGQRVADWVAGTWKGTYQLEGGQPAAIEGFFRGGVKKGALIAEQAASDSRPWFVPAKDFKPPTGGEHPRLFFRKGDVPELKRRASTPEGQRIIARLRQLLNGSDGESMPTRYNPAKVAYPDRTKDDPGRNWKGGVGAYTISHAAGYGFLFQLTGDAKYAQFARECVGKAFAGQRNADPRYSWVAPGGELRAGPSLAWYAVAYDLCYDAWDEGFRTKVARTIQDYKDAQGGEWDSPESISLREMVLTPKQGPGSNHYGAVIGGCGLAVLAVRDDPGTDKALLDKYQGVLERQVVRHFLAGWGDGGYYKEGWGASRVGTQAGFLCYLQALRTAAGRDFLNVERTSASYVTMVPRCLMMLGGDGRSAYFPYRSNMGGTYGNPEIGSPDENDGFSSGGYFSEGLGAVADRFKPGLLWTYNHVFDPAGRFNFDTFSPYPHRAMLALVNWPTFSGIREENPAKAMPLATRDRMYEYFVFRNRFQDANDVVATVAIQYPDGTKPREVMVWGMGGLRLSFGEPPRGATVAHYVATGDGSGSLTAGSFALAVDYSKASGADALIVGIGNTVKGDAKAGNKARFASVSLGSTTVNILTLSAAGRHPDPKTEGDKIVIGGQKITWNGKALSLAVFPSPR